MTNKTNCNPAVAPGTATLKQAAATADHEQPLHEEEHKAYRRAVGQLQWKTYTRPDICYATKQLAASTITTSTNNNRSAKAQVSPEVHQGYQTLQAGHTTNSQNTSISSTRHQRLRRQRLGRLFYNEEINNRFRHHNFGHNSVLRQQNTSNSSTQQRGSRALRHQHRYNRSTLPAQPPYGTTPHQTHQHQNPHGFQQWQKHGNTHWLFKESQTH